MSAPHQFALLTQRRFGPFFTALFLGTLNDNLLKFAVTLLLTYQMNVSWLPPALVGPVTGALFILPSVVLSAWSGQVADRWPLDRLLRGGKALEVVMMVMAAWAVWQREVWTLLACLVLSGVHVTVFSTLKYAYVPRHLTDQELLGGNGLLEMGLFTAILLGTLLGGWLVDPAQAPPWAVPLALVALALLGRWRAQTIPATPALEPGLSIDFNPVRATWQSLASLRQHGAVLPALLGISWMWFFGATFLALFPALARDTLHADATVATGLLLITSLGIGVGALMCERLSRRRTADGLVVLGAVGMACFGGDLTWCLASLSWPPGRPMGAWSVAAFVAEPTHWRLMADLGMMAVSVGWFSVPLYADMQARSEPSHRARVVAANNLLNAVFILASAAMAAGLSLAGWSVVQTLAVTVGLHAAAVCGVWVTQPRWRRAWQGALGGRA